jgi:hypothetical protein
MVEVEFLTTNLGIIALAKHLLSALKALGSIPSTFQKGGKLTSQLQQLN